MGGSVARGPDQQDRVSTFFDSESSTWEQLYTENGSVLGQVIRDRHAAILQWIGELELAPNARALEVGCGAGFLSIELARRGFDVTALDASQTMVERARRNAREAEVGQSLSVTMGDVHGIDLDSESFDLVVAVGVLSWLHHPELAVRELARVTKPGGHVVVTVGNWLQLRNLLDPLRNPLLSPVRLTVKRSLERAGMRRLGPAYTYYSARSIERTLKRTGLHTVKDVSLGFGPLTLFEREVVPEGLGVRIHGELQRLALRGVPVVRSLGASRCVLAVKEPC